MTKEVWEGIQFTYPPFDPKGKRYKTKYVRETYDPKTRIVTVEMIGVPID